MTTLGSSLSASGNDFFLNDSVFLPEEKAERFEVGILQVWVTLWCWSLIIWACVSRQPASLSGRPCAQRALSLLRVPWDRETPGCGASQRSTLTSDRAQELSAFVDSISVTAVYHASPKPRAVKQLFDYAHDFLLLFWICINLLGKWVSLFHHKLATCCVKQYFHLFEMFEMLWVLIVNHLMYKDRYPIETPTVKQVQKMILCKAHKNYNFLEP